jgi:L-lactate permease
MCVYTLVVIVKTLIVLRTHICMFLHRTRIKNMAAYFRNTVHIFHLVSFDLECLLILQQFQSTDQKFVIFKEASLISVNTLNISYRQ